MASILEIKYFNSFVLKKRALDRIIGGRVPQSIWNGSFGIPGGVKGIGGYPIKSSVSTTETERSWAIEEARIRGGYNNTSTDYGVRAYLVEEDPNSSIRFNSLIYSGIYNSRTGVNNTNVFSVAEDITKSLDPVNGSIQRLFAEDTNLLVFQESKVSRALIDKDAIYSAEGQGTAVSSFTQVIGQMTPINGNYGIGNHPESFAVYGYNKYFVDSFQNCVMRLGGDGSLVEISSTGMRSFFRNNIINVDTINTKGKIIGAYDIYNKDYVLSLQPSDSSISYNTVSYDESAQGWISRYSYKPDQSFSLRNQHYTTIGTQIWLHNSLNVNYNNFYGVQGDSSVRFIVNPQVSTQKVFKTVNYEGSNGWQLNSFVSDETGPGTYAGASEFYYDASQPILSYVQGAYDSANPPNTGLAAVVPPIFRAGFYRKENKYCSNLISSSAITQAEVLPGFLTAGVKGFFATVTFSTDSVTDPGRYKELFAVSTNFEFSNGY